MIEVNILSVTGASPIETRLIEEAQALLLLVLNAEKFREALMTATFTETNLMHHEIYDKLTGKPLAFHVRLYANYKWWSKVVGYVNTGSNTIHINRKYLRTSKNLASTMLHEYSHILGFKHKSASSRQSVPYMLNKIFEECVT